MRTVLRNSAGVIAAAAVLGLLAVGPVPDLLVRMIGRDRSAAELVWLHGCWEATPSQGTRIRERWRLLPGDTLWGVSVTVRGDSVVDSERMHIVARGERLIFVAEPARQARAEFTARSVGEEEAVFENAAHDFPQRVSYRVRGDSLHARIEGVIDGAWRAVDFPMRRATCTTS